MLTSDLLRVIARKQSVKPRYLDTESERAQEKAEQLTTIFEAHVQKSRGEIDDEVEAAIGHGTDFLIWRGLAKLLYDRSTFETVAEAEPVDIRRAVFEASTELGPVTTKEKRAEVLAYAAERLAITAQGCEDGLYADLDANQILTEYKKLKPLALLRRYNLALAQAVLYKATRLMVELDDSDPNRLRYIFQSLKFFGLMHRAYKREEGWLLEVDGPASLFSQSRKYGLQMAKFLPALALCESWRMRATLAWSKGSEHIMEVSDEDGLVSHYTARGQWVSDEEKMFESRFAQIETDWELERRGTLHELDAGEVLISDYVLKHPDGRVGFVEIVGFWRKAYLERRIDLMEKLEGVPLVLVVGEKLNSDRNKLDEVPPAIVFFKTVILVDKVISAVEEVCSSC